MSFSESAADLSESARRCRMAALAAAAGVALFAGVTAAAVPAAAGVAPAPAGAVLAFTDYSLDINGYVAVMGSDGSGRRLLRPGRHPRWSPDGQRIAFDFDSAVWVMAADGSNPTRVTSILSGTPDWSPDGQWLVFAGDFPRPDCSPRCSELAVVNVDGTNLRQLTHNPPYVFEDRPAWSPDGTRIAYQEFEDLRATGGQDGDDDVRIMPASALADGERGVAVPDLDFEENPAWSPDSTRVLFNREAVFGEGCIQGDILSVDVTGGDERHLTSNPCSGPNHDDFPAPSPHGRFVAFDRSSTTPSLRGTYVLDLVGGDPVRISDQAQDLDWRPDSGAPVCTITGTPGNDVLRGTPGPDVICAGGGDDVVYGGGGKDVIEGGPGDDMLRGGVGNDTIRGGAGNDVIRGDEGNDVLVGDTGADALIGGDGNDTLTGGPGADTLTGGSGTDHCSDGSATTTYFTCETA